MALFCNNCGINAQEPRILSIILQHYARTTSLSASQTQRSFSTFQLAFCSSISTVDTADKFIYLNCALPSSAIIADKYLCFQNKLNTGFAAKSCLERWKGPVLTQTLFSKSLGWFQLFFMILPRTAVSCSETNSSQAEEDSPSPSSLHRSLGCLRLLA